MKLHPCLVMKPRLGRSGTANLKVTGEQQKERGQSNTTADVTCTPERIDVKLCRKPIDR